MPWAANRKREVKVPELVINSTSLNTGHLWRFEADRMGEHARIEPETADPELASDQPDGNRILRPGYFVRSGEEIDPSKTLVPQAQQDFPLALAVAASAAVPGIFSTLPISGMYANARVQLVDGGVADNQGVQSLADHGCDQMIVSDGSGQMQDQSSPRGRILPSLSRTTGIQGDRIRDLQLQGAGSSCIVHLREGLTPDAIEPDTCWSDRIWPSPGEPVPGRPVHPETLDAISRIRTDLDTFSESEIDSLACCGYLHMDWRLENDKALADLGADGDPLRYEWGFLEIRGDLAVGDEALTEHLRLGHGKLFRFLLGRKALLKTLLWIGALLATVAAVWLVISNWSDRGDILADAIIGIFAVGVLVLLLSIALAALLAGSLAVYRFFRKTPVRRADRAEQP